jgi:hypothetical protein
MQPLQQAHDSGTGAYIVARALTANTYVFARMVLLAVGKSSCPARRPVRPAALFRRGGSALRALPRPAPPRPAFPQRILHVDYAIPSHVKVSEECRDLLHRILVADPTKRITIDGIYNHKWYMKGLPPGVREMNDRTQPPPEGLQVGWREGWRGRGWAGASGWWVRRQVAPLAAPHRKGSGDKGGGARVGSVLCMPMHPPSCACAGSRQPSRVL